MSEKKLMELWENLKFVEMEYISAMERFIFSSPPEYRQKVANCILPPWLDYEKETKEDIETVCYSERFVSPASLAWRETQKGN